MPKEKFYAIRKGRSGPMICCNWSECTEQVKGFSNAEYKRFDNRSDAELFIKGESPFNSQKHRIPQREETGQKRPAHASTKRPEKLANLSDNSPMNLVSRRCATLFFDGGARGNPGKAGSGAVLYEGQGLVAQGSQLWRGYQYFPHATSNEAEYEGLIMGLEAALLRHIEDLQVFGDSKLIVMQVQGKWKVEAENLKGKVSKARQSCVKFRRFQINHVPRNENVVADRLANQAMDTEESKSFDCVAESQGKDGAIEFIDQDRSRLHAKPPSETLVSGFKGIRAAKSSEWLASRVFWENTLAKGGMAEQSKDGDRAMRDSLPKEEDIGTRIVCNDSSHTQQPQNQRVEVALQKEDVIQILSDDETIVSGDNENTKTPCIQTVHDDDRDEWGDMFYI